MPLKVEEKDERPMIRYTDLEQVSLRNSTTIGPVSDSLGVLGALVGKGGEYHLLEEMLNCESGNNPDAVNPCDVDGTPSFSCLQFKPLTLKHYAEKYGLADTVLWDEADLMNWTMDCEFQKTIFLKMVEDPEVLFSREFPACFVKHYDDFVALGLYK
jgi:hypothetical protein